MDFKKLLGKELLFFDGAMGTMLQTHGLQAGELPEEWNFTHPEAVQAVHEAYLNAGANIIKTNTFGANRLKFKNTQMTVEQIVTAAVTIAKQACANKEKTFVALDLGPTGKLLAPYGDLPFEEAIDIYAEIVRYGVQAGADLILIETMSDTYEVKAALLAAKENSTLPVVVTMSFDEEGKLLTGADVTSAAILVEGLGADAIGFNCGLGPEQMSKLLPELMLACSLPIVVNPNAGLPIEQDGKTIFNVEPQQFAELMKTIINQGVAIAGGCCGTTPKHIKAMVDSCAKLPLQAKRDCKLSAVSAYGKAVILGQAPVMIGERINPTGKPRLKQALLEGDLDYVCRLGLEQIENGAAILDVNVGVPGIDETDVSQKAVQALQAITVVPLQIDTSNYETMAAVLRLYNGKPLLNSVSGKEESLTKVLPLAKKYGAAVVALTLDDDGIPQSAEGRIAVADKILKAAAEYGIAARDILIDPLALTISTGADNAQVALRVIRELTARGLKTVMGVSNISFGLPNREAVNSAFFAMTLEAGLSCAIINPQSETMKSAYYAAGALNGWDIGCKKYVEEFAEHKGNKPQVTVSEYTLYEAVIKGLREQSKLAVTKLLTEKEPLTIINEQLIPALDFVGQGFESKKVFLPQLLMSADAAKAAFELIRNNLAASGGESKKRSETIVIATVHGDIHDIGKNIVKVLLENYGYHIIDLGKDVPVEVIVNAVQKNNAKLVGLSALMTTTVKAMEATIKALQNQQCDVMVGGAVLTQEYADKIGASFYAPNAVSAVNYANRIFKK